MDSNSKFVPSRHTLFQHAAVKSPSGELIFQGGKNGTTFEAAGILFLYLIHSSVSGDQEELLATGPIENALTIQVRIL